MTQPTIHRSLPNRACAPKSSGPPPRPHHRWRAQVRASLHLRARGESSPPRASSREATMSTWVFISLLSAALVAGVVIGICIAAALAAASTRCPKCGRRVEEVEARCSECGAKQ